MTRHVMIQMSAAGAAPPATEPCAHLVIIGTDKAASNGATCQQHQAEEQRNVPSAAYCGKIDADSGRGFGGGWLAC
jgi:hypothetical protein